MDELYDKVYHKLRRLLSEQLGIEASSISRDSSLIEDLDAAPIELYDEVFPAIEHAFDVEISPDEARSLLTVQDMVDYIVDKTELLGSAGLLPLRGRLGRVPSADQC